MATTVQPLFGVATVRKNDCEKILTCLKNLSIGYLQSITPLIQTMRTLADSSTRRRTSYGRQKSVNKEPRTIRGIWSFAPVELLNQSRRTCLVRIYVNAKALRYKPRRTVSRIIQDKLNALARFHSLLKANGRISIRLKTYSIEALQTPTSLMLISAVGAVIASHSRPISFSSLSATGPAQSYGLQDPQDPEKADTPTNTIPTPTTSPRANGGAAIKEKIPSYLMTIGPTGAPMVCSSDGLTGTPVSSKQRGGQSPSSAS